MDSPVKKGRVAYCHPESAVVGHFHSEFLCVGLKEQQGVGNEGKAPHLLVVRFAVLVKNGEGKIFPFSENGHGFLCQVFVGSAVFLIHPSLRQLFPVQARNRLPTRKMPAGF